MNRRGSRLGFRVQCMQVVAAACRKRSPKLYRWLLLAGRGQPERAGAGADGGGCCAGAAAGAGAGAAGRGGGTRRIHLPADHGGVPGAHGHAVGAVVRAERTAGAPQQGAHTRLRGLGFRVTPPGLLYEQSAPQEHLMKARARGLGFRFQGSGSRRRGCCMSRARCRSTSAMRARGV